MNKRPLRSGLVWASALAFVGILLPATVGDSAPNARQMPKLLRLSVGATMPVESDPGSFERVLVMPPQGAETTVGNAWEITTDVAIRLSRLSREQRWRAIRRNLGLAPEDDYDLILWSEVVDAALDTLARLPSANEPGGNAFGLRVAFPDRSTEDPAPDVALLFPAAKPLDLESDLKAGIADVLTGVEGFVTLDGGEEAAPEDLAQVQVQLLDSDRKPVATAPLRQGYFCFPRLSVDPDFGSDYYLQVIPKQAGIAGLQDLLAEAGAGPRQFYVPVVRGLRTQVRLTMPRPARTGDKSFSTANWPIGGGAAAMLLEEFVGGSSLLGIITERLPANPGLHLGVIQANGQGPLPFYSTRFVLRPPTLDRRPQFVTPGRIRLQCLTDSAAGGSRHFVKMSWLAHAEATELKLASRHVNATPWGIGIGVAPSAEPTLYGVGASYKLRPEMEVLAGVGLQKDRPESFIYGLTVDVDRILGGIFGDQGSGE